MCIRYVLTYSYWLLLWNAIAAYDVQRGIARKDIQRSLMLYL